MNSTAGQALLLATLAGLSTGIGGLIAFFLRRPRPTHLALILGFSAGVMLYISFAELLAQAIKQAGLLIANIAFFIGLTVVAVIDVLVPHEYKEEHAKASQSLLVSQQTPNLLRMGVLIALGITIHNLPEGLAVFSSTLAGGWLHGIQVAIAISLHNIPEGISVSAPIYAATHGRWRAFLYASLSGLAEPLGAVLGYAILFPFLTPTLLTALMAFAGGIMVYISLDELLPAACQYGETHPVMLGVAGGMLAMAFSLILLR